MNKKLHGLILDAVVIAYLVIGIYTFGHSVNHHPARPYQGGVADNLGTVFNGFFSAVLWPLYWSAEFQKP